MPSHHRITVNLPTRKLYSSLKELAQKRDLTMSRLILEIVIACLRFDASSARFLEELRHDLKEGNAGEESFNRNVTGILHRTTIVVPKKDTGDTCELIVLKAVECRLPDYEFTMSEISSQSEFHSDAKRKMRDTAREEVRRVLKEYVLSKVPAITGQLGGAPDFLHMFVKKAMVKYYEDNDSGCNVRIQTTLHVLPLFLNDVRNSRLDFPGIRFRQFKALAVKGWDKSKYEKMVFVENASETKSGGYFIGLVWNKVGNINEIYEGYEIFNTGIAEEQQNIYCRVHMNDRDVKFKNTIALSLTKKDTPILPE
ncbi:hypothetical protein GRG13_003895 [Salmonella enterica]|nr:hypothetical protein [Salmonella enterica]EDY6749868.1 hypothetical protein [Salmonella enterica]EEE2903082.1 hypothetical protein [Salmonella enterica subsp. enterica serovar Braenderup]